VTGTYSVVCTASKLLYCRHQTVVVASINPLCSGPKHFKIRRSVFFVCVELARRLKRRVGWVFFPSRHGKTVNDSHAANVKRLCRRLAREGRRTEGVEQLANVAANLKNSDGFFFELFDREEEYDCSSIDGIRSFHYFEWDAASWTGGDKYTLLCTRFYPELDKRSGALLASNPIERVEVEAYYSIDFDDHAGLKMDLTRADVRKQRVDDASEAKEARIQKRVNEALQRFRTTGTSVSVRYDADGKKNGEWWSGKVVGHRVIDRNEAVGEGDGRGAAKHEQILVRFDFNDLARRRGAVGVHDEWVDLDTGVRLVA